MEEPLSKGRMRVLQGGRDEEDLETSKGARRGGLYIWPYQQATKGGWCNLGVASEYSQSTLGVHGGLL